MSVIIRRRRAHVAIAVALLATTVAMQPNGAAGADVPADDPYRVEAAVDVDPAPDVFETTITARPAARDIGGGVTADMWTFNGTVPGPEIRLRVADTLVIHYRNELPLPSSIHWHGIELNNASDGTALTQNPVAPGGTFLYRFKVPRPGIFWYHPHHNPTNQVFRGLYGSLIVTDDADDTLVAEGVLPPRYDIRTLMLSDTTVCKAPGANDTDTYDDSLPWAGGGSLPEQPGPFPIDLCERPMDDHGNPVVDDQGRPVPLRAGEIPNIQQAAAARTNEGQTVLVNGREPGGRSGSPDAPGPLAPGARVVDIAAGRGLRLQATNAATTRYFQLRMTDAAGSRIPLVRVGGEGGLLDAARVEGGLVPGVAGSLPFDPEYERGEIVLGPSDRADIVVAVPPDAALGPATLWTLDFRRTGPDYALLPTVPVMHLNVTERAEETYSLAEGAPLRTHPAVADPTERLGPPPGPGPVPVPDLTGAVSPLLDPASFTPPKPGSANENIRFVGVATTASVDFVKGNHESPTGDYRTVAHTASTRYARLGDLLELTVTNTTSGHHVFHLHGFSFQPLAFEKEFEPGHLNTNGVYTFDYPEFVDSIDIPGHYTLRLRVRLDDRPQMDGVTPGGGLGRWVFHCHVVFHAVLGMHSELVVLAPDGNEKPFVDADAPRVAVTQGGTATATGTFVDPDGDPVTLSASAGTVTDAGNSRWSWSLPTGQMPAGTRTVHVTAVDDTGFRAQTAFALDIANVAPEVTVTAPPPDASFAVGSTVTVAASIADPGEQALSCRFDWDDGAGPGPPVAAVDGGCRDSRVITQPGVRTVTVIGDDGEGGTDADTTAFAVFDPDGGFVTGSGTEGSGQAAFDLSVRYLHGVPVGQVVYTRAVDGFDFAATGFDWLVVAGPRAQARGSGAVGGVPGHGFVLTVVDGAPDRLRLKVWDAVTGRVVHDDARGRPDDIDTAGPPPIAVGSIRVHR